jgi:hypothetical protein
MDIAAFISELLEHENELSVPGLGTFFRSRMEGYYSKEQQQFYPPSLQLQFNPELQNDDNKLVQYMAEQNQINTASARYFLEKYIEDIIEKVETENVLLGELGTFSMRRGALFFVPKRLNNNNELFYGLAPVKLRRNRMQPALGTTGRSAVHVPITEKPSAFTAALLRGEPMPGKPLNSVYEKVDEQEETAEGEKKPNRITILVLVLSVVILISGVGLICAYKYNPALFERFIGSAPPPPATDYARKKFISDSIKHAIETEKSIGMTPNVDSNTLKKIVPAEVPRDTFGIVVGKFAKLEGAKKEQERYGYGRISVEIRKSPTNTVNPYQLVIATYDNADSATVHLPEFKAKLYKPDIFIEQYPYKKPQ